MLHEGFKKCPNDETRKMILLQILDILEFNLWVQVDSINGRFKIYVEAPNCYFLLVGYDLWPYINC